MVNTCEALASVMMFLSETERERENRVGGRGGTEKTRARARRINALQGYIYDVTHRLNLLVLRRCFCKIEREKKRNFTQRE